MAQAELKVRTCGRCGESDVDFADTEKKRSSYCKPCNRARVAEYKAKNPDRVLKKDRSRYSTARDRVLARQRDYYLENKHLNQARRAKRRAAKLQASGLLTAELAEEVKAIYAEAEARRVRGEDVEVDHEVPLQGKNVCGLHVPWNLQIIGSSPNRSKGNRHEP